jgi:hypothetical protein
MEVPYPQPCGVDFALTPKEFIQFNQRRATCHSDPVKMPPLKLIACGRCCHVNPDRRSSGVDGPA